MARQNNIQPPAPHQPLHPDLINKFLNLQQKELEIRTEELAINSQREANGKAIAEASIAAQLQDRESERGYRERKTKHLFVGSAVIISIILVFMGYALFTNNTAIVEKALIISATFASGFVGGYGFKTARQMQDSSDQK